MNKEETNEIIKAILEGEEQFAIEDLEQIEINLSELERYRDWKENHDKPTSN